MDIRAVERRAAQTLTRRASSPTTAGSLFASRLTGATASAPATDIEGARVQPPAGGCACDAMAAMANPSMPVRPMPTVAEVPGRPVSISPASVRPGDLLLLDAVAGQADRMHIAIARSATEMLAPDASGLVTSQSIPWNQVRGIRRPV